MMSTSEREIVLNLTRVLGMLTQVVDAQVNGMPDGPSKKGLQNTLDDTTIKFQQLVEMMQKEWNP